MKKLTIFLLIIFSTYSTASVDYRLLNGAKTKKYQYLLFAKNLVNNKMYFSAVPFIKEYLAKDGRGNNKLLDHLVDQIIDHVGVRQFEVLPIRILNKVSAPIIHYIKARKFFRRNRLKSALIELKGTIGNNHSVKPFALLIEGSILSMLRKHSRARASFKQCISKSKSELRKTSLPRKIRQLKINMENCKAGISRDYFASRKYLKAELAYLDIDKKSFIWPELLFEEAWNSFYQKNYNRTLGKLVTYKAPLFNFIFNPEIYLLRALTYMELCLWNDVNKTVDEFYKKYENQDDFLRRFLRKHGRSYRYYYLLADARKNNKFGSNKLVNKILHKIIKDPTFVELYDSLQEGKKEFNHLSKHISSYSRNALMKVLKDSILLQRNLIGAYVRKELVVAKAKLYKSFEGMSYIKLSILSKRKSALYQGDLNISRSRGNIKYLKRNDKQYFWSFNGEFWADELGDYVFTLKSECKR